MTSQIDGSVFPNHRPLRLNRRPGSEDQAMPLKTRPLPALVVPLGE